MGKNGKVPADWKKIEATEFTDCDEIVVPEYFKTVRDFKSSCDWFTTGDKSDLFQAIGDAFEWTKVSVDELPRTIEFGANNFEFSQVRDMIKSATKISDSIRNIFSR